MLLVTLVAEARRSQVGTHGSAGSLGRGLRRRLRRDRAQLRNDLVDK